MKWKCILSDPEVICYQKANKSYAVRIEARHSSEGWTVYKSYYNDKGLNLIDSFEARSREEMESLLGTLQSEKDPSMTELNKRMVNSRKSLSVKIERAYKEYNVEKWYFTVNGDSNRNVVVLRLFDSAEADFIVHKRYARYEEALTREIMRILGVQNSEEEVKISCYYFTSSSQREIEPKSVVQPHFEFDWTE